MGRVCSFTSHSTHIRSFILFIPQCYLHLLVHHAFIHSSAVVCVCVVYSKVCVHSVYMWPIQKYVYVCVYIVICVIFKGVCLYVVYLKVWACAVYICVIFKGVYVNVCVQCMWYIQRCVRVQCIYVLYSKVCVCTHP